MGASPAPKLRRSHLEAAGIRRQRRGKGFSYAWPDGSAVSDVETLARVKSLVLPPAWTDVWICPWPDGHVQALGTDAAGRRQYRYHDDWRLMRDAEKHERVLRMANRLPAVREQVATDIVLPGLGRERVLAAGIRLLDLGFFRIGGENYAQEHNTFGLATLRKKHVRVEGDTLTFEYDAKGSKHRIVSIVDAEVLEVVSELKKRRGGGDELLAYRDGRQWRDVRSHDLNAQLRALSGFDMSAKDFRTWHATVLMAVALAVSEQVASSPTGRERAISRAYREVSTYLGNTPAVCRKSYVDPILVDLFEKGITISRALERLGAESTYGLATQGAVERAVVRLLAKRPDPARVGHRRAG
jgi:DNA topoisomerase-1